MFLYCPLYTCGISIVLAIRSVDPRWGLDVQGFRCIYTPAALPGLLKAGAQGISIAVTFRSFDRTLQIVLFKQALNSTLYI